MVTTAEETTATTMTEIPDIRHRIPVAVEVPAPVEIGITTMIIMAENPEVAAVAGTAITMTKGGIARVTTIGVVKGLPPRASNPKPNFPRRSPRPIAS